MNILVTGGAGYLGSVLLPKLVSRGHRVRVVDGAYFGLRHLKGLLSKIEFIHGDLRLIQKDKKLRDQLLDDCDCVVHLAAISNDPSADLNVALTEEVNCEATRHLALAAKERGARFIFSSTAAVYGSNENEIDENGELGALTTYAKSKVKAEEILMSLADQNWKPLILRNGTLYGLSPRMRFDVVLNIFSLYSVLYNEIKVFGDGLYWRPFLHVADCARAIVFFAEKDKQAYSIYNVSNQNFRVCDLVPIFQSLNPNLKVTYVKIDQKDNRNYKMSTQRLQKEGFQAQRDVTFGAEEMLDALVLGLIRKPESIFYSNAKWMAELMADGKLNKRKIRYALIRSLE